MFVESLPPRLDRDSVRCGWAVVGTVGLNGASKVPGRLAEARA
jgi:hypothetical protein